jgi:Coenzyme PQQ synthesis protein D (PqqD)
VGNSPNDLVKLRTDNVVWRQVGDEVMILDTESSEYLSVNESASLLWPLLLEGCARAVLGQTLVDRFGIDDATAATDVEELLAQLGELGLLEKVAG